MKKVSFCGIRNNPTPSLLFVRPHYKYVLKGMEFYDKFEDIFQDLSKVKNHVFTWRRSNNYFKLSRENISGNMILSH